MSVHFIERVCDFMLGKKSPLCGPGEKRFEMGGSFSSPNFTPLIRILTQIMSTEALLQKYPLNEVEKKMLLHVDLLKGMLSSPQTGKKYGACLANMCRDNVKLSQKVSKVFIKSINNANFDNVKFYLSALKPFLKLEDSLKEQKLEWIFGFSQIVSRKGYREERYKYGLELVDRISEEAHTYICPIACGLADDSLLAQLLRCKGKLDTFAINCLKEMLSLMAKDETIARFIFKSAPPTYQCARYSDWFRPYLEYQKSEVERTNAYSYFKNKHDALVKSLDYLDRFEKKFLPIFKEEEDQKFFEIEQDDTFRTFV